MTDETPTMRAIRLHAPGGPEDLILERVQRPRLVAGEALVRVHAAAITRDELTWPVDRLPAIPSYELSGIVADLAPGTDTVSIGASVFALTSFDRDGVAAEYAAVPVELLAPKPDAIGHDESAAIPLPGLTAWQGLFVHGGLEKGQRVLIHGAGGGVGHIAVQLAHHRGAYVIGSASPDKADRVRGAGADEVVDRTIRSEDALEPVDLVFDTVGGELLARLPDAGGPGRWRIVSVAEEPPAGVDAFYFVVEPNHGQLLELGRLVESGDSSAHRRFGVRTRRPARSGFERSLDPGTRGKVVLRVVDA